LKNKKVSISLLIFTFFFLVVLLSYQHLLRGAAGYLTPSEDGKAEVVILEGTQVLRKGALTAGKELLSQGKAFRLVVVLHQTPQEEEFFALPSNYPQLVRHELERMGLKRNQFLVLESPVSHPITLTEAKFVLAELSQIKVRSAILISEGFHTRRSFGVYQQEGKKRGIRIIPQPYYIFYQKENWWLHTEGVRAFVTEYLKLGYYLLRGYIPLKGFFFTTRISRENS
jgi:uncharacterized SAM-binding protein YcdF (DUF218 family)